MADIHIPKLGDNIEGAEITAILVAVGDTVEADQALLEVESDKAAVEIPAPQGGKVTQIHVSEGDQVQEGQVFMTLASGTGQEPSESPSTLRQAQDNAGSGERENTVAQSKTSTKQNLEKDQISVSNNQAPESNPAAEPVEGAPLRTSIQEVEIPKLGDGIEEAEITAVLVKVGDVVEADQTLLELESDKATVEMPAPFGGILRTLEVQAGDSVSPGQVVMRMEVGEAGTKPQELAAKDTAKQAKKNPPKLEPKGVTEPVDTSPVVASSPVEKPNLGNPAPASPAVRRFARELGVDIQSVTGSGPRGRISVDDVKRYVKIQFQRPASAASASAGVPSGLHTPALPDFSKWGEVRTEKTSNIRKATAQHMSTAWNQIPHVTQYDAADITDVEGFRKGLGAKLAGGKLTVTAILLKITALALKQFETFNASLDMQNQQIIYKDYVHVGVAVDTPRGLLVPVIRDADKKGIKQLSNELGEVAAKARDRKLSPDEMSGATFTISNLGGLGTTYFTPIVNWPEVAILGVGRAKMEPVWQNGEFTPRLIMPLSLSYDHRLIDGANAARFLRWIAMALETPLTVFMEGEAE